MSQKLVGSVCLITGASAGIGKACALALAKECIPPAAAGTLLAKMRGVS